jgi:putative polyhydroxyalkanoate system protein
MADIRITHAHALSQDEARHAAQQVAAQLAQDYDVAVEWNGDVMQFERTGVAGSLTLAPNEAQIELRLGLLFKAFAPAIEQKLAAKMRKVFG